MTAFWRGAALHADILRKGKTMSNLETLLMAQPSISVLLASTIIAAIERSGATEQEVYAAIGVVQSLLPTLVISR